MLTNVLYKLLCTAMSFTSDVKEHRERLGLSQERLARELGVSRQTIVNIERGINEPRVMLALALAAVLGVAVDQLFKKGRLR
jgi:putative transcriptional regulator